MKPIDSPVFGRGVIRNDGTPFRCAEFPARGNRYQVQVWQDGGVTIDSPNGIELPVGELQAMAEEAGRIHDWLRRERTTQGNKMNETKTYTDMFGREHKLEMKDGQIVGPLPDFSSGSGALAGADCSPAVCASEDEILLWVQQRKKSYERGAKYNGENGCFDAALQYHHAKITMQEVELFILSRRQAGSATVRQPQENDRDVPTSGTNGKLL